MRFYHGLPLLLSTSVTPTALGAATRLQPASQNHHELRSLSKATNGTVTKTFKFKDDFFLRISTLSTAISPGNNTDELLGALEEYAETFRDEWVEALMGETLPDNCAVLEMSIPEFSICMWRYPDYYDINELPAAGQSYIHPDTYVQRLYYQVESLKISCLNPDSDFPTYQDLDRDLYTSSAFEGTAFTEILNPESCQQDCFYSNVTEVTYDTFSEENAALFVQRFMDVEMYLKCVDMTGYGTDIADVLIEAMDRYFELYVEKELEKEILSIVPEGSVYNFASPYEDSADRLYFTYGAYYTGGNIVAQVRGDDGVLITKYDYGFDVIWFWPKGATDDIIPSVPSVVNPIYQGGAFLAFLQQEYSQYTWVQRLDYCEPVDTMPEFPEVSFVPTPAPTEKPTQLSDIGGKCTSDAQCIEGLLCHQSTSTCVCNKETNFGCEEGYICEVYEKDLVPRCYCDMFNDDGPNGCEDGQYCRFSCKFTSDNPRCVDDPFVRDCGSYGEGYTCADANNDGVIDVDDKSGGCDYKAPTSAPQTLPPVESGSPTLITTPAPTVNIPAVTPAPTMTLPTPVPSPYPSKTMAETITCDSNSTNTCPDDMCCVDDKCVRCICHPVEKPKPIVGTCGNGNRGDGICAWEGYCCSEWGWCGTTPEYCDGPSNAPTPSGFYPPPTPSLDAGKCGSGDAGEGLCADPDHCCSQWGYCGPGEGYCYVVDNGSNLDGTCGGGGVGNGVCGSGQCCSQYGYCGEGSEYCTGYVDKGEVTETEEMVIQSAPLPDNLLPVFGYRCGVTEVDARSNCKPQCTHHIQCARGEECWGIQLNYCNTFEEGSHPVCKDLDMANTESRCGFDEVSAREHCGPKCQADSDCGEQQFCYPTILNLCDCFENLGGGSLDPVFTEAEDTIKPYFLGELVAAEKPVAKEGDGNVEGVPRSSSSALVAVGSLIVSLLVAFANI
ncbi:hypothetical protein ACHAW6_015943 [Cyclotella cf. meneghiniana]